jgi:hypothetical protein
MMAKAVCHHHCVIAMVGGEFVQRYLEAAHE